MGITVDTAQGKLRGLEREGHQLFRGIPFAKPPVGERRFSAPEAPEAWTGVREATEFGPASIQGEHPVPGMAASGARDEDCLYLNVYTPAADGARRPVLFWIHGGGFQLGAAYEPLYDGAPLVRRGDVVVVSIHYRLGALGSLYLGEHGGDAWGATANAGQLDQVAALRWVQDNITAFGGDPDDVTIFGESAGSAAVATLLTMPAARGLFRRGILESGTANLLGTRESSARVADAFLEKLGLDSSNAQKIRSIPVEKILAAQLAVARIGRDAMRFAPIVDGETVPIRPLDAVRDGAARDIQLMIGTNRDEVRLFTAMLKRKPIDDDALIDQVRTAIPRRVSDRAEEIVAGYRRTREGGPRSSNLDLLDAITTDVRFRLPAIQLAEAQRLHQPGTYLYLFVWESPARGGSLGACHALEMPFVFGTIDAPTQDRFAGTGPDAERLSRDMMDSWIAFARSGDPSHEGIGSWEPYDDERRPTLLFGQKSELVDAPFDEEVALWKR